MMVNDQVEWFVIVEVTMQNTVKLVAYCVWDIWIEAVLLCGYVPKKGHPQNLGYP